MATGTQDVRAVAAALRAIARYDKATVCGVPVMRVPQGWMLDHPTCRQCFGRAQAAARVLCGLPSGNPLWGGPGGTDSE